MTSVAVGATRGARTTMNISAMFSAEEQVCAEVVGFDLLMDRNSGAGGGDAQNDKMVTPYHKP